MKTIEETIAAFEEKIELQKSIFSHSKNDAAKMKCLRTIENYKSIIKDLKTL